MNVNEIISKINNMNLQSEEDLQEVESVLTEMDDVLIEPLFRSCFEMIKLFIFIC